MKEKNETYTISLYQLYNNTLLAIIRCKDTVLVYRTGSKKVSNKKLSGKVLDEIINSSVKISVNTGWSNEKIVENYLFWEYYSLKHVYYGIHHLCD